MSNQIIRMIGKEITRAAERLGRSLLGELEVVDDDEVVEETAL